ncbi:MAG TPA: serine hydrolase domain-containing protein [Thermoanaerobaculia bacterium]|nr:serine hydrolase domain-containing protein [Thermoanaerobaculia bacterium]
MRLAEQGKLDLDAPVSRYVPEIQDDRIRIKHLLSHTSEGTRRASSSNRRQQPAPRRRLERRGLNPAPVLGPATRAPGRRARGRR